MNWYTSYKLSMALPEAEEYPQPYGEKTYAEDTPFTDLVRHNTDTIKELDTTLKNSGIIDEYGPLSYIGAGTNGVAYYSSLRGVVIKITFDYTEAKTAERAMDKQKTFDGPLPHVATIYDVREISEDDKFLPRNLFIIVMEKLEELSAQEKSIINFIVDQNEYTIRKRNPYKDAEIKKNLSAEYMKTHADKNSYPIRSDDEFYSVYDKVYDVVDFVADNLRIDRPDIHGDNLGRRPDGSYVLIDL